MSTCNEFDDRSITIDDCETAPLSAIPILPGGMVNIALSELGATIADVYLIDQKTHLLLAETV